MRTMTHTIDVTATAKLVRPLLKGTFPAVKFSVRSDRYAGGSAIHVTWTDGPTTTEVSRITDGFTGGRFEGLTDCPYFANSWYCHEHGARPAITYGCDLAENNDVEDSRCCHRADLVHFRVTVVHLSRRLSPEFRADLETTVAELNGREYNPFDHSDCCDVTLLAAKTTRTEPST